MTGRVTMLGIARWGGDGASYRTIQRFFATVLPWAQLFWLFFRQHLLPSLTMSIILAGDEVVVTKAGKKTFGLDRFFSSIYQKAVPGVAFFSLALVTTTYRRAFPLRIGASRAHRGRESCLQSQSCCQEGQAARSQAQARTSQRLQDQAQD